MTTKYEAAEVDSETLAERARLTRRLLNNVFAEWPESTRFTFWTHWAPYSSLEDAVSQLIDKIKEAEHVYWGRPLPDDLVDQYGGW